MGHLVEYLSGNVPGGFGLYLFLVIVIFLVLFSISRRNELFTGRHFKIWFTVIWALLTLGYAALWFKSPPAAAFSRYGVFVVAAQPQDEWQALYWRDELSRQVQPATDGTTYQFFQRWFSHGGLRGSLLADTTAMNLATRLPVEKLVWGVVENGALRLQALEMPAKKLKSEKIFTLSGDNPEQDLAGMTRWMADFLPVLPVRRSVSLADRDLVLGRQLFYEGRYRESLAHLEAAAAINPENKDVQRWQAFAQVRLAREARAKQPKRNPFDARKKPWQQTLDRVRGDLVKVVQSDLANDAEDPFTLCMVAEAFMLEEYYQDGEEFLKLGFSVNPFSLEVLWGLSLLHETRLKDMPVTTHEALYRRILALCPFDRKALEVHSQNLLSEVAIDNLPGQEAASLLNRAQVLTPGQGRVWHLKGIYQNAVFQYREAVASLEKAAALEPADALVQFDLGISLFKLKDPDGAQKAFEKAVSLDNYLDAHLYLGVIFQERGQYEKALERFRYRVAHKTDEDDYYAQQAMKGIRECLDALKIPIPQ